jgi:hypothetical protein
MTSLDRASVEASAYQLSEEEIDGLVQFAADCLRLLGDDLEEVALVGAPDAPVVAVVFSSERQRPGVVYSYEWRLRDLDDEEDANPLGVLLVDYLGNNIIADLRATPGLPMWDPDDGVVHVDVRSEAYRSWSAEWRKLGRPWRDERRQLRHAKD